MTVKIIINADDLGGSESINRAVFAAIDDGVISSSTLLANGLAFDDAARTARELSHASFGVHMNLTQHVPVSADASLAPLLDERGEFRRNGVYEVRWTPRLQRAVVAEWVAQVRRVQKAGISVSHLDSHHHVHTIPALFSALKRVQRETGIRRVRGTWTIYDRQSTPSFRLRLSKRAWWWALRNVVTSRTTSEFSDFLMFRRAIDEGSYAPRPWPDSIELMVHPSEDPDNAPEIAALRTGWLKTFPVAAQLVSYNEL